MGRFDSYQEPVKKPIPIRMIIVSVAVVVISIVLLTMAKNLIETNHQGFYQVKQSFITGKMSVRLTPGTYGQWLGKIDDYKAVATVGFGRHKGEGTADVEPVSVMFSDGSKATVSGIVRIELPATEAGIIKLKNDFSGGYNHFITAGVVPIVENAIKMSANLRSAQDAYTTLALFQQAVQDQLENGMYLTKSEREVITSATGETEIKQVTVVALDENHNPIRVSNKLQEYGCKVSCVIDVPVFDPKVEEMISLRKDEAMKTELAKQSALRATQDALTAEAQGKANVAKAKYEREVEKVKEVTDAQKQYEVAALGAKKAEEEKKIVIAEGQAQAEANRLKVAAGLSPQEAAEWKYKTTVGVAAELAKSQPGAFVPKVMVNGGGSNSAVNAMDAVGIKMLLDITNQLEK